MKIVDNERAREAEGWGEGEARGRALIIRRRMSAETARVAFKFRFAARNNRGGAAPGNVKLRYLALSALCVPLIISVFVL